MNNIPNEILQPTKNDINDFIHKNYPIKLGGRVYKSNEAVIEFYKDKVNEGFIIADEEARYKIMKEVDEYWRKVSQHINEKYNDDKNDLVDGLTIEQYTELCIDKNKQFMYDSAISDLNIFNTEHKQLVEILNDESLDASIKVEKLKELFKRCDDKFSNLKK